MAAEYPPTLLGKAKWLTNWYDRELAEIVGLSRAMVSAIIVGREKESLTPEQRAKLLKALQDWRDTVTREVENLELLC